MKTVPSILVAIGLISSLASSMPIDKPRKTIAGVTVLDTQIVRDAQAFARAHTSGNSYNHMMSSYLLGMLAMSRNASVMARVDEEAVALGILLHDLGLDESRNSTIRSRDRRFEVDGAIAATSFIRNHADGRNWNERRLQLVWDSIALHMEPGIANYKELEVQLVAMGYDMSIMGPDDVITKEEYEKIKKEFPNPDFLPWVKHVLNNQCMEKPSTTYGTLFLSWGCVANIEICRYLDAIVL